MSAPASPPRPGASDGSRDDATRGDAFVRRVGRQLVTAFYGASRAIQLYPPENAAVQKALGELVAVARQLHDEEAEVQLRVSREFIFCNATRLRLELDNFASFGRVLALLRGTGIGQMNATPDAQARDWLTFLSLLQSAVGASPEERLADVQERLERAGVQAFALGPLTEEADDDDASKETAKRTYAQSVAVTRDVMHSLRMGQTPSIKKIKRAVQGIVDQVLNDESSLLGLTALRDFDEYTFTHSVNVGIFAVALGKRLGLARLQLYDLAMAALLHDIGKSRLPLALINKSAGLSSQEWEAIATHPWRGVLALFDLRGQQDLPYRAMAVAYEHHMKVDFSGYPLCVRPREMSIFSKIVAVADGFDAATSRRSYQQDPHDPAEVLRGMRDNPGRGLDPTVVKAFVNMLGIYPVGTCVVLDSLELGVVHAAPTDPALVSRPVVRVVSDERGNVLHPGHLLDLTVRGADGAFQRTIINTADPEKYGIRIADYFV